MATRGITITYFIKKFSHKLLSNKFVIKFKLKYSSSAKHILGLNSIILSIIINQIPTLCMYFQLSGPNPDNLFFEYPDNRGFYPDKYPVKNSDNKKLKKKIYTVYFFE
jgi:hypothetical protein